MSSKRNNEDKEKYRKNNYSLKLKKKLGKICQKITFLFNPSIYIMPVSRPFWCTVFIQYVYFKIAYLFKCVSPCMQLLVLM